MNNKNKNIMVLLLAALLVFCVSCEKSKKDYRKQWVGTYECRTTFFEKPTVIIDITISGDSLLYIAERDLEEYEGGVDCDVKVDNNGDFKNSPIERPLINGNFYGDSLFIDYLYPAPGSTVSAIYKGKKIKK